MKGQFFQKWGGWILAGVSSIGVGVTAWLAGDEVPKAKEALKDKEDLSFIDKAKIVVPICAPSIISGTLTVGSIIGNQALNAGQQASLIAAGALGSRAIEEYDKYRQAIRAEQGDAVDRRALDRARLSNEALRKEIEKLRKENGPYLYSISTIPELIFEARPADIQESFLHFNRNLILRGQNDLKELYTFIGIPTDCYCPEEALEYGWNEYYNQIQWDCGYCDFDIEEVKTKNGTVVRLISMPVPPYDLSIDYENDQVDDHVFHWYSPDQAKQYIQELEQIYWEDVITIDHPYIYRLGLV